VTLRELALRCLEREPSWTGCYWETGGLLVFARFAGVMVDGEEWAIVVPAPPDGLLSHEQEAEADELGRRVAAWLRDPIACLALATGAP
jgi:hypothetical protein